jgi:hypothetical protein
MAKPTLLEMVQDILGDMDADEVNSISDTAEAEQVASIIRNTYRSIVEEYDLQATEVGFRLDASGTSARPTHMTIPDAVFDVTRIRYDVRNASGDPPSYRDIPYCEPGDFLDLASNNDSTASNYQDVTDTETSFVLSIRNDEPPSCYTSLDGGITLIFDSFDSALESTLQQSKTQCLGHQRVDLTIADTSEIDLPETMQQLVYNDAREMCFDLFKDGAPRKVNERARYARLKAKERKNKLATPADLNLPDYGRR